MYELLQNKVGPKLWERIKKILPNIYSIGVDLNANREVIEIAFIFNDDPLKHKQGYFGQRIDCFEQGSSTRKAVEEVEKIIKRIRL
jgi:hypothetical protein